MYDLLKLTKSSSKRITGKMQKEYWKSRGNLSVQKSGNHVHISNRSFKNVIVLQAGITTTLNSRCSVLAAANSVFGRWDDTKGEENIDFMPTILSRFDMIFVVKDEHDERRDTVS